MKSKCERCGNALAADGEAYICSYECTFCGVCSKDMGYVCPNCGGGLVHRPVREAES